MPAFDRRMIAVIAGLLALLAGLALLATWQTRDSSLDSAVWLYLVAPSDDRAQVWKWATETARAELVAHLPGAVVEVAALPSARQAVYAVARDGGEHDLWRVDVARRRARRWLDCAPDDCRAPAPGPDGQSIVFTRVVDGRPTLWQLSLDAPAPIPLFPEATPGHYAAWSPDGARVAYVDPAGRVCVAAPGAAETLCVPALTDAPLVWSPDGAAVLITDLRLETGAASHILRMDVTLGVFQNLSDAFGVEDDAPAWSPDGAWIAFRRRAAGTAMGKQLWLMRADGSDPRALTTEVAAYYGPPVWAPDGETILASRHVDGAHQILAYSITSETTLIARDGYLPALLPASK